MSATKSNIEWTDTTWNPSTGCSKVSPGCANCYAETLTKRHAGAKGWPAEFLPWTPANAAQNVVLHPDRLEAPFSWRTPRRVFVNSMSDLFHEEIPDEFIAQVFAVMALTPQHTYQVLTKRPERMRQWMDWVDGGQIRRDPSVTGPVDHCAVRTCGLALAKVWRERAAPKITPLVRGEVEWPLPNVWLGVTVENQRWADERIPILLETPAAVRFLSCEPMLGPIDLTGRRCEHNSWYGDVCDGCGTVGHFESERGGFDHLVVTKTPLERLDWIIVGGESGPKHRAFDPAWARNIVAQCEDVGVACFVKQLGGARPGTKLEDLPEDLRVREFPEPPTGGQEAKA